VVVQEGQGRVQPCGGRGKEGMDGSLGGTECDYVVCIRGLSILDFFFHVRCAKAVFGRGNLLVSLAWVCTRPVVLEHVSSICELQ